ncbi:MAG: BrnA antitoxin family protein [Cyanobacteriota bacterium]
MRSVTMSKPLKKISLKMPTLEEDELITAAAESDPDALPLTDEQMRSMVSVKTLRGRPKLANKKKLVSIRYSPEVIDYFKASGAGWQARMDAVLREYVEAHSTGEAKGA